MKYKKIAIIFVVIIAIILILILKNNNPETSQFYPPCLIYKFTGLKCAGCGITRATHHLLNFNFKAAFYYNPLIYLFLIYTLFYLNICIIQRIKKITINNKIVLYPTYFLLAITVFFMIIRNII